MTVRVLPDFLINQIAAGEVVERPASVVKELVENALDAGADEIVVDVSDGGRTMISVIDNGRGISHDDLPRIIMRHATSKLPDDDLTNITFMGFRGEALPSIASVSDMTIDTHNTSDEHGWCMDCVSGDIRPSAWESGTRIRVNNLFAHTPARLKFLRGDRAEMMSTVDTVKRLAMARVDVGFTLNNKWRFPKNQDLMERICAVMGDDVRGRMLNVNAVSATNDEIKLTGFISEPTLRRASSVDQYLFVNGRPVKDKVLTGALRAAYMDVMHAREFPLCALYLTLPTNMVDVNVSPAKTEVHFLEPAHIRAFIIKTLRTRLATPLVKEQKVKSKEQWVNHSVSKPAKFDFNIEREFFVSENLPKHPITNTQQPINSNLPLGRVIGQIANKYILATTGDNLVIIDQHAAHERITYEKLRTHKISIQPLLTPIVVNLRTEDVNAILSISQEMRDCGLVVDAFGDDAIAIFEKPSDWDLDWTTILHTIADEVRSHGHSSGLQEKLHLKLANYACHHSVRAGQKLDMAQMDALLRDIENTERAGECNHGRPVYKFIPVSEVDKWFER